MEKFKMIVLTLMTTFSAHISQSDEGKNGMSKIETIQRKPTSVPVVTLLGSFGAQNVVRIWDEENKILCFGITSNYVANGGNGAAITCLQK